MRLRKGVERPALSDTLNGNSSVDSPVPAHFPGSRGPAAMTPRSLRVLCLLLPLLLPLQVLSQDFDLFDALGDKSLTPAPTKKQAPPAGGAGGAGGGGGEFKLEDAFDVTTTKVPPKVLPKAPSATKASAVDDFDLADALDPKNDIRDKDKDMGQGGGFSDKDLIDVGNDDTYQPDKGKGKGKGKGGSGYNDQIDQYDDNGETTAEVGTIAGIASAVAMALVGAISSYISYQKKKLCFSIQQSLNADMVKAENPEGVVATEPQAQQTLLEPPNAEPRTEENVV